MLTAVASCLPNISPAVQAKLLYTTVYVKSEFFWGGGGEGVLQYLGMVRGSVLMTLVFEIVNPTGSLFYTLTRSG